MAFAVTSSSTAISGSSFSRSSSSSDFKVPQIGSFRFADRHAIVNLSQKRFAVKAMNAEPKRNVFMVPLAATIVVPEVSEKVEVWDYEQLAKQLDNASPLEIMDKALEKFGNDIAIAFRKIRHKNVVQ